MAGAVNGGGHIEGGPHLIHAATSITTIGVFGGPNAESFGTALSQGLELADPEIHLAVAPHGALDPALLAASISIPVADARFWWLDD